jgi:hypothetical protein
MNRLANRFMPNFPQSEATEPEDALEMGEQHLDALAVATGLLEGLGLGERSSHVAGVLVDVAQDPASRHVSGSTLA